MVATSFWKWRFNDDWQRFRELLLKLLGPDANEDGFILSVSKIMRVSEAGPLESEAVVSRLLDSGETTPRWLAGGSADAGTTVEQIVKNLRKVGEDHHIGKLSVHEAVSDLRRMTIRLFLPATRAGALFGASVDSTIPAYSTTLDFSFICVEIDKIHYVRCVVSASVWSDPPYSGWHAPEQATRKPHARLDLGRAELMAAFYLGGVRDGIRRFLETYLEAIRLTTIHDTPFEAPIYWFVAGDEQSCNALAATLLGTHDLAAARVSTATEAGSLKMYRRMLDYGGIHVPLFVFLPRPVATADVDGRRSQLFAAQERNSAQVVLAATELELKVATLAYDIDTDLELWVHYLQMYDKATMQGSDLWDAVAMHLPVAPRQDFDRAHRIVALIHQTLLQSVADFAYVTNKVQETRTRLENQVTAFQVEFDRTIAEHRESSRSVSAALGDDGYRGVELRRIEGATSGIERIKGNFQGLFDAITKAFDERRTRETDRFSRSNLALAGTVAVFGVVTVLATTWKYDSIPDATFRVVLPIVTWILGVLVVAAGAYAWWALRGRRLGSREFRKAYEQLRDYLRQVSTVELRKMKKKLGDDDAANAPAWDALDKELSDELVRVWTSVRAIEAKSRSTKVRSDLVALENNVGQWTLRTMLLNERPIRLFKYNLPRLIALYCALSAADPDIEVNAVARFDVDVMIAGVGFDGRYCRLIYDWLCQRTGSVAEVARDVAKLRLSNEMTDDDRTDALKEISGVDQA